MKRSDRTTSPHSSAGRITSSTSWARAAANSSASARGSRVDDGSSSSERTRSPTGVPPGSRVATTLWPCSSSARRSSSSCVDLPAPSTPSRAISRPRRQGDTAAPRSGARQRRDRDLCAALGAGRGIGILVRYQQAATLRAGYLERRLPHGVVAVRVAVAAVERLAPLGPLGDHLALPALGAGAELLLAEVLDATAFGIVRAAEERPEATAALDHRLAAFGARHVGQLRLRPVGLLGRLAGVATVLAVRVAAARQEPAIAAPPAHQLGAGLRAALGADLVSRLLWTGDLVLALGDGVLDLHEEGLDQRLPRLGATGDVVEVLLHLGCEAEVDHLWEDVGQQVGHDDADVLWVEALGVQPDVLALEQGRDGGRVGRRPPDAVLLQCLDQARLGEARRRLGEVLLGPQLDQLEGLPDLELRQGAGLFLSGVVAALEVDAHEAVEAHDRAGGPEHQVLRVLDGSVGGPARLDVDRGLVVDGLGHLGGDRALPDQVVESLLVAVEVAVQRLGRAADLGGTDRLVRLLGRLCLGPVLGGAHVTVAVALPHQRGDLVQGGLRQGDRVGPHIGDQADGTLARQLDALVELLRQRHRLLGGEAQLASGLLLQRGGGEGRRGAALALAPGDVIDHPGGAARAPGGGAGGALVAEDELLLLAHRVAGVHALLGLGEQVGLEAPVLLRPERLDLALTVHDHLERGRLYPPGRQAGAHLAPQDRRELVADDPVDHPACLLGVDQVSVNLSRVGEGAPHRVGGDLREAHAADRVRRQLGRLGDVPGDGLALAVRVGRQKDLLGRLGCLPDVGNDL